MNIPQPRIALTLAVAIAIVSGSPRQSGAQSTDDAQPRGPRFLLTSTNGRGPATPVDVGRSPLLRRSLALNLENLPLKRALAILSRESGLEIVYSDDVLPADARVTLRAERIALAAALTHVLLDANVDVVFTRDGRATLAKRKSGEALPAAGMITGRVTDSTTGQPVPLAQVAVVGTSLGAATDATGRYSISGVPAGDHQLTVRRIGFEVASRRVHVDDGGSTTADFALARAATSLDAVVTTVTGNQRKVELGNTLAVIAADSLVREAPVMSLPDLLTARVPGVMVNFQAGYTGIAPPIRIRGLNSFTMSNDPLVIVDGARVEATSSTFGFDQYGVKSSRLGDLNPDEFESIEVVKGPSAATLYGTDAANGVIVIRTKRGAAGPAKWQSSFEGGLITPPKTNFPTGYYGWGHTPAGAKVGCTLALQAVKNCSLDSLATFDLLANPDWTVFGDGHRQRGGAQVSGGSGPFRYFGAGEIEREVGFIKMSALDERLVSVQRSGADVPDEQLHPNALRKINVRGNMTATLSDRAELSLSNSLMLGSFRTPNSGTIYQATVFSSGARTGINTAPSSVANSFSRRNHDNVTRYVNSVAYNWRPLSWLATRSNAGLDFSRTLSDQLVKAGEGGSATGARVQTQNGIAQYTLDLGATAHGTITSALSSKTSAGVQYNRRTQEITATTASGLAPGSETVTGAATITGSESKADAVVAGAYLEQEFGLRERLYATVAVRTDGSSSFGRNLHTTAYPKAGLSWLLSEEPFMPHIPTLGTLRLRAAYGASGVQPPSTAAIPTVSLISAVLNGATVNAVTLGSPGNPDVKPERSTEVETGFDADFVDGRVHAELTYYSRRSTDALLSLALPVSAGGNSRYVNIGSVTNRGLEALLNLSLIQRSSFNFDVSVNASTNANKLVSRDPASDKLTPNPSFLATSLVAGYPLYGLWQKPIVSYADANSNGIIESGEVTVGTSAVYLGPDNPTKQLSVTPTVSILHGLAQASALFDWRGGYKRLNFGLWGRCTIILNCRDVYDPATPLADQAKFVAYNTATTSYGYIYDATFLKLREVSLTVRAPDRVARALRVGGAGLTLAGRNLVTWTQYPDDPEVNGTLSSDDVQTQNTMPAGRYWIARINLFF